MLHDRVGGVEQPHAALPEAPPEVEVLVVEDEVGVETACGQEEFPLQRHVARVEARPTCLPVTLQLEEAVVEQRTRPVKPAVKPITGDRGMPCDATEHGHLVG